VDPAVAALGGLDWVVPVQAVKAKVVAKRMAVVHTEVAAVAAQIPLEPTRVQSVDQADLDLHQQSQGVR
jgi:hypothetical protein